jgi:hypothetical protein
LAQLGQLAGDIGAPTSEPIEVPQTMSGSMPAPSAH